ncbi:DUF3499 domain-containing protein [Bowdeniella massiliensis]|uniref:DUF3499 domain-containing protein n=1 Tax=Bowdeniella massiliensis TaxID=2932264 RepID=UPI0020283325
MKSVRPCVRPGCTRSAVATLTYVYGDAQMIVGPLSVKAEPHAYDLCEEHARTLTAPRGWDVIRLQVDYQAAAPSTDDLTALADAVREASKRPKPYVPPTRRLAARDITEPSAGAARPNLRIVHSQGEDDD